jgi:hypothetical protein
MGTSSAWTPERRAKQAEAIRRWRPWDQSTGPKTETGKARVARNAYKGGQRVRQREHDRLSAEFKQAAHEATAILCAIYEGKLFYRGEPLFPEFGNSAPFLAAWARSKRAEAAWQQHERLCRKFWSRSRLAL